MAVSVYGALRTTRSDGSTVAEALAGPRVHASSHPPTATSTVFRTRGTKAGLSLESGSRPDGHLLP